MAEPLPAGIVLAGGRSARFGSDKASVLLLGVPLLQWAVASLSAVCSEVLIAAATGQGLPELEETPIPTRVARDEVAYRGPMAAMANTFAEATADLCVVVSCDAPLIQPELLRFLISRIGDAEVACPEVDGRLQPLVAVYRKEPCLRVFRERLAQEELGITAALSQLSVVVVKESELRRVDPDLRSFVGVNTPAELDAVAALIR